MNLFNFHTHNKNEKNGIINLFPNDHFEYGNKLYSIGYHPWYYEKNYKPYIDKVKTIINYKNIVALGETGFDLKSSVNIEIQKTIFLEHVKISEEIRKPIIIHCVKFQNELIELKKLIKPTQAWIFHNFKGKLSVANELNNHDFYFSISAQLFFNEAKAIQFLKMIPHERLFIETDDKDYDLLKIYNFTASILRITIKDLADIINNNLKRIGV